MPHKTSDICPRCGINPKPYSKTGKKHCYCMKCMGEYKIDCINNPRKPRMASDVCSKCKVEKKRISRTGKRYPYCDGCWREFCARWRGDNKESLAAACKRSYLKDKSIPNRRMNAIVSAAKKRAREKNIPFSEDIRSFLRKLSPLNCECCGKKFNYSADRTFKDRNDSASLDRVIPELGYVIGNIEVICYRCNWLKQNSSLEEIKVIVSYMERKQEERVVRHSAA